MPSREDCAISAYNTATCDVTSAFTGSTARVFEARDRADTMRHDEVFDFPRDRLPYPETRDYLLRIAATRRHYKAPYYLDS